MQNANTSQAVLLYGRKETGMKNNIDWGRMESFVRKEAKTKGKDALAGSVFESLKRICEVAGDFSCNRKMLVKVAKALLQDQVTIIAPCCPDFSHEKGIYTLKSVSGGVSLLAQKHIAFLELIAGMLPEADVIVLLADQEANDKDLCHSVGKTVEEFAALITQSIKKTAQLVSPKRWKVFAMTEFIPDLADTESEMIDWIRSRCEFDSRLLLDTMARSDMYWKINRSFTTSQMQERTIRTAAQYIALGKYVSSCNYLVCNHTTVNLSWYLQTEAAVLHNPVSIY